MLFLIGIFNHIASLQHALLNSHMQIFHSPTWLRYISLYEPHNVHTRIFSFANMVQPFPLENLNLAESFDLRQGFRWCFTFRRGFRLSPGVSPFARISPLSSFTGFRFRLSPFAQNSFA